MSIDSSTGVLSAGTVSSSTLDGQILETLAGICDGRGTTVESGTYTLIMLVVLKIRQLVG